MVAIPLLVVNLVATIYFNYRRQEDYDDGGRQSRGTDRISILQWLLQWLQWLPQDPQWLQ